MPLSKQPITTTRNPFFLSRISKHNFLVFLNFIPIFSLLHFFHLVRQFQSNIFFLFHYPPALILFFKLYTPNIIFPTFPITFISIFTELLRIFWQNTYLKCPINSSKNLQLKLLLPILIIIVVLLFDTDIQRYSSAQMEVSQNLRTSLNITSKHWKYIRNQVLMFPMDILYDFSPRN